ncbi:Phage repressor protein C, contains Cro/C1-type HTH and peptisase s24 domains [Bradyrhizobium lablabi]|uniref:Phage repressor protein C, contains Cro/C1-type HTH and peptisase s24 domains n=1 Tax=Bradyrhizobium lablabi TaxID=722472 RepID=A0A1H5JJ85_9BRAD|nr:Phage repressor protein C, contains Cro/C1-type HTH and peptisase s24 domains [Bradyrhizobium lablabi]
MVRKLILEKLEEKGLTMSEASLRIGYNHAYLQQFLKRGHPLELPEKSRLPLAELLGVPEDQLRGPSSKLPKREYVKVNPSLRESLIAAHPLRSKLSDNQQLALDVTPGSQLVGERDLPVFGTAQGGSGALIVTDGPVDWVVRPDPLLRVKDGYGMIVTGDSMDPVHKHGSTALVNPHIPWRSGDTCIFRSHHDNGDNIVIIKELRRFTDDTWYVRQYNPPKDFTLKRSEWQVCHVTVGNFFSR